jgi:hypothetical protein
MIDEPEGGGRGLVEILARNLVGGIEENHIKPQSA